MRRRDLLAYIAGAAVAAGRAGAQQPAARRIGVLSSGPPSPESVFTRVFPQALAELGWIDGANVVLDWRDPHGRSEGFDERAAELVRAKPDVIVATTPAAVIAVKRATASIPVVMVNTADPVELSIVDSLSRPGGNITGTSSVSAEVSLKQLELLTELLPQARRVAVLSSTVSPWHPIALAGLEPGARKLKLALVVVKVGSIEQLDDAVARIAIDRLQALVVLADPITFVHRRALAELAARYRLPAIYGLREHVEVGGLMSYWANSADLYRRTAAYVDKILRGAHPATLPIEQPTRFELVLNLKTARALGIAVPQSILARADELIE
jgi:putative tryptophan/tyrosine transport system substrate-binding protein